jgi:hypothetical protein
MQWSRGEQNVATIGFCVAFGGPGLVLRLGYRVTPPGEDITELVLLETTQVRRGGPRWWGRCPLIVNGRACNRRVGKLYLPPGGRHFGCRHCYQLTYTSSQRSWKPDSLYRAMDRIRNRDFDTAQQIMKQVNKRRGGG